MEKETFQTNLLTATQWLSFEKVKIDLDILQELNEDFIYDTAVNLPTQITEYGEEPNFDVKECYITDLSKRQVEFLVEHFNLTFAHHPILNRWFLLVYDYVHWAYIPCQTDFKNASRELGYDISNKLVVAAVSN